MRNGTNRLIVVKVGSSSLTGPAGDLDPARVASLAGQIADLVGYLNSGEIIAHFD